MTPGTASLAELFADTPEELRRQALSIHLGSTSERSRTGRLAFLGDSVLGLSVATLLFQEHPDAGHRRADQDPQSGRQPAGACWRRSPASSGSPKMLSEEAPDAGDGLPVDTLLASERTLASLVSVLHVAGADHGLADRCQRSLRCQQGVDRQPVARVGRLLREHLGEPELAGDLRARRPLTA